MDADSLERQFGMYTEAIANERARQDADGRRQAAFAGEGKDV